MEIIRINLKKKKKKNRKGKKQKKKRMTTTAEKNINKQLTELAILLISKAVIPVIGIPCISDGNDNLIPPIPEKNSKTFIPSSNNRKGFTKRIDERSEEQENVECDLSVSTSSCFLFFEEVAFSCCC
jgi:hypothetical protein